MNRPISKFLILGSVMLGAGVEPLKATDRSFVPTSGNWNDNSNWSPSGVPTSDDQVTVASGKTCYVDISSAQADHLVVAGTLSINAGTAGGGNNRKLTVDGTDDFESDVTGTINLLGQYSSLVFTTTNQTLTGTNGKLVGQHNNATLDISGTVLTSEITVEGNMRIAGSDNADQFKNDYIVNANHDGVLLLENCRIDDDVFGSSLWKVASPTSGTPILRLNHEQADNPTNTALDGEFQVYTGLLDIQSSFYTSGKVKHYGGKITTDSDATVTFSNDGNSDTSCPAEPCQ